MKVQEKTSDEDLNNIWTKVWENENIVDSIKNIRKDENLRWKLKYAPLNGKILEAGCGVGQYVIYFKKMGFDIEGIDISRETVEKANLDSENMNLGKDMFFTGDVRNLPYDDNSLSYYLSMGVVEHFIEGPKRALDEAYRVLKPGGIAYIATPTKYSLAHANSFIKWLLEIDKLPRRLIKNILLKINFLKEEKSGWIENLWSLKELKDFVKDSGFIITDCANTGLKSTFDSNFRPSRKKMNKVLKKSKKIFYPILDKYEDRNIAKFGLNNIVVAIKPGKKMHCFFCDSLYDYNKLNLGKYSVTVCQNCCNDLPEKIIENYIFGKKPAFVRRHYIPVKKESPMICTECQTEIKNDMIFGDLGFEKEICQTCIKKPRLLLDEKVNGLKYENY
tara:strand:+ start:228 stop:1397 length:1170 start_codon:yes stop_codon:yes gene_type:complete